MRDREKLSQEELAEKVGMNQNAISRLENPFYGKPTLTTLKRLAAAFDVGLVVRFVPFGELVDWVTGTPHINRGLSAESLSVPSFQIEMESLEGSREVAIEERLKYPTDKAPHAAGQMPLDLMPSNVTRIDVRLRNLLEKTHPGLSQSPTGELASTAYIEPKMQNLGR